MWKDKRSGTVKTILKKENEVERRILYDFKAYCIAILMKTYISGSTNSNIKGTGRGKVLHRKKLRVWDI